MPSEPEKKLQTILANIAAARGFNAVEGSILGTLLLHSQPRTQRDIAAAVGRSQSTISRALRRLIDRGVIEWRRKPGSREMLFSLVSESPKGLILSGLLKWLNTNSVLRDVLEALIDEMPAGSDTKVESVARDLIGTIDYVGQVLKPALNTLKLAQSLSE
ncbi:MAG: MarR family transcriptional regulator [Candidatus Thorarchaeota archaeon]|nr:MarR family transcriptional regulator [Candidatus Thorarchaeota archaeon]